MSVRDDTLRERFCSLHSKRFRASSSRKLGREQKKKTGMRGEGEESAITRLETLATQAKDFVTSQTKGKMAFS